MEKELLPCKKCGAVVVRFENRTENHGVDFGVRCPNGCFEIIDTTPSIEPPLKKDWERIESAWNRWVLHGEVNEPLTLEIIEELKKFEQCNAFPTWALILARQTIKRLNELECELATQKARANEELGQRYALYQRMISVESSLRRNCNICLVCAGSPDLCPFCVKKKKFEIAGLRGVYKEEQK